jgi:hypothetical protein
MRLLDFLVADDIRQELGNKTSVMGIFNNAISLNVPTDFKWPFPLRLGLYIRILSDDTDEIPNRFQLKISLDGKVIAEFKGNLKTKEQAKLITLQLSANPLPIPALGVLNFQLELLKENVVISSFTNPFPINVSQMTQK